MTPQIKLIAGIISLLVSLGALGGIVWAYDEFKERGRKITELEGNLKTEIEGKKALQTVYDDAIQRTNKLQNTLDKIQDETNIFRDCVDAGDCGLRIDAVFTAPATITTDGREVENQKPTYELNPDARQNYYALRENIKVTEALLTDCSQRLELLSAPYRN